MKIATTLTEDREAIVLLGPEELALVVVGLHNFARLARLAAGGMITPQAALAAAMSLQADSFLKEQQERLRKEEEDAVRNTGDSSKPQPGVGGVAEEAALAGGPGVLPVQDAGLDGGGTSTGDLPTAELRSGSVGLGGGTDGAGGVGTPSAGTVREEQAGGER